MASSSVIDWTLMLEQIFSVLSTSIPVAVIPVILGLFAPTFLLYRWSSKQVSSARSLKAKNNFRTGSRLLKYSMVLILMAAVFAVLSGVDTAVFYMNILTGLLLVFWLLLTSISIFLLP